MSRLRDTFVQAVLHGGDKRLPARLLRGALTPLALLHQAGLEAYLLPYRLHVRKKYRLPVPVIAIGNLSSGGTGKTPMAALVAGYLQNKGQQVVLLSRGHGGSAEADRSPRVVSDGTTVFLTPEEAGDEPVLLARLLPHVPIVVGRDRRRSGALAVERFAPDIVLCDDALQYWQLHRDLDIVLLDALHPFDNGFVLPRGLLREPPSHLARAGIVVFTRADRAAPADLSAAIARASSLAPRAGIFTAVHAPVGWLRASDGALLPLDALAGEDVRAFAGIADGQAFFDTVRGLGAVPGACVAFADHHAYTPEDAAALALGSASVTTEKDLVKVGPLWPVGGATLYALRIGMQVNDPIKFFEAVEKVCQTSSAV